MITGLLYDRNIRIVCPFYDFLFSGSGNLHGIHQRQFRFLSRVNGFSENPVAKLLASRKSQTFSDFLFQCCRIVMQRHFYLIDPYHLCSDIPSSAACIPATKPLDHAHCRL